MAAPRDGRNNHSAACTVVTPVLQMLYPMMVWNDRQPAMKNLAQRYAGTAFLISSAMALGVLGSSGPVCGGTWGLKLCQPLALQLLLISAVMLSVLRALVLYQSARGRDLMALSMLLPAAAYLYFAGTSDRTVQTVATQFTIFSALLLFYYGGLICFAERRRNAPTRYENATSLGLGGVARIFRRDATKQSHPLEPKVDPGFGSGC